MFCCLAGTSHRVAGSCLAFWVKRSRAGGVREGHSGNRSLSSPTAGRDASLTLALFFPPPSSFLLPTHSCKSLFLWLTLFFFSAPCFFLFLHSFTSCFFFFFFTSHLKSFLSLSPLFPKVSFSRSRPRHLIIFPSLISPLFVWALSFLSVSFFS